MIRPALVVEQVRRSRIRGQQNVEKAVVVDVAIRRGPRHFRRRKDIAHLRRDFRELSAAKIAKQVRRLGITHALLHPLDLIFNMAVGDENILPAVVVVIEKEAARSPA